MINKYLNDLKKYRKNTLWKIIGISVVILMILLAGLIIVFGTDQPVLAIGLLCPLFYMSWGLGCCINEFKEFNNAVKDYERNN